MNGCPHRRPGRSGAGPTLSLICLAIAAGALAGQDGSGPDEGWWAELPDPGPGLHVFEADSIYEIRGRTYGDLLGEMRRRGPGVDDIGTRLGVHVAQWRWSYEYRTGGADARCRVTDASVILRSVIVLPEWVDRSGAVREVARAWPRFVDALVTHELGHRTRARRLGVSLWQSLLGLQAETCEALGTLVSETASRIVEEGEAAQLEYDRETGHGVHQGAVWPP